MKKNFNKRLEGLAQNTVVVMVILFTGINFIGCKKDFLEARPQKSLVVPTTLEDFQALFNNGDIMNQSGYSCIFSEDDITTTDDILLNEQAIFRNSYLWAKDIYENTVTEDWDNQYKIIFYSNVVLDGLAKIKPTSADQSTYNALKGAGLFYRAKSHYQLSQIFCQPYNPATAEIVPGVPVKLSSDVNIIAPRGTLARVRSQVIKDLEEAISLLPVTANTIMRPSKVAAYGFLARIYLDMQNYGQALNYAKLYLGIQNKLLDYNVFSATASRPFPVTPNSKNEEIAYYEINLTNSFTGSTFFVVPSLYGQYESNDLRRALFFKASGAFKGTYTGNGLPFTGISTDEILLIRAECYARSNNVNAAMNDLNTLLITRWKTGSFIPFTATSPDEALFKILIERRKQLLSRGLRWFDLRRLNQDPRFATTITRTYQGVTYTLKPNSNNYTFPIPNDEIRFTGLEQNPRD